MAEKLVKITVNLLPQAYNDLREVVETTQLNNTDTVNRALSVYAFISRKTRDGDQLIGKRPDGSLYEMLFL